LPEALKQPLSITALHGSLDRGIKQVNGQIIGMPLKAPSETQEVFQGLACQFQSNLRTFHTSLSLLVQSLSGSPAQASGIHWTVDLH
jgi:hypothetical protein